MLIAAITIDFNGTLGYYGLTTLGDIPMTELFCLFTFRSHVDVQQRIATKRCTKQPLDFNNRTCSFGAG